MKTANQSHAGSTRHRQATVLAISGACALLVATAARASDEIYDTSGVAICCLATYDYTAVNVTAGAFIESNNASFVHFSPNYDPLYGAVATTSTSNVTNLTAGGDSVVFPGLQGKYPYLPLIGVASASSDLKAGQVHAVAISDHLSSFISVHTPPGSPPPETFLTDYYSIASADARFSTDFQVSNSGSSDVFLPVSWTVHGAVGGPVLPLQASSFFGMTANFSNGRDPSVGIMDYEVDPTTGQILTSASTSNLVRSGFANMSSSPSFNFSAVDLGGGSWQMSGLFDIQPGVGVGTLEGLTQLVCWQGATCDFGNTSSLSFGALPAGVSIQFDAPGFLHGYGLPNGVPEPAGWVMMLAGLGVAGAMLRRGRGGAPSPA